MRSKTKFKKIKGYLIEAGKIIGAFLLLLVLVMGLSSFILFLETKEFPFIKKDEGRAILSLGGGIYLWYWILRSFRRANMTDHEKRYFDKSFKDGDSNDDH